MKITCDVAKDLAEIYFNGTPSDETQRAVKNHLHECKDCRSFYADYKNQLDEEKEDIENKISIETSPYIADEILSESLKKISKRLRKRRIIANTAAIVTVVMGLVITIAEFIELMSENDD